MFKVGDRVYSPFWELGTIEVIHKNYICCKGTETEHTHDAVYDVRLDKGNILNKGCLYLKEYKERTYTCNNCGKAIKGLTFHGITCLECFKEE